MTGVLITGHGSFSSGLLSAVKLLASEQELVIGVDFLAEHSTDTLKQNLRASIDKLGDDILILADLQGGSPYNVAVELKTECAIKHIEVVAGGNLPMILTSIFEREDKSLDELVEKIIKNGQRGIKQFELLKRSDAGQEFDDGI